MILGYGKNVNNKRMFSGWPSARKIRVRVNFPPILPFVDIVVYNAKFDGIR